MALNSYIGKKHVSYLHFHPKKCEKKKEIQESRRKEEKKIRAEINGLENRKINEYKRQLYEQINKTGKTPANDQLKRERRHKLAISGNTSITTNSIYIKRDSKKIL